MKIVQIAHGYPPAGVGGTECYVKSISNGLLDRGHAISVYAGSVDWKETFFSERTVSGGIDVTRVHRNDYYFDRWDKAYNPLVEAHFRDFLAAVRPDVIHVHQWIRLTSNLCALAAEAGIPAVVSLHDLYTTCPRLFRMKPDSSFCNAPLSFENCARCTERWLFQNDDEIRFALDSFRADITAELLSATHVLAPSKSHADKLVAHGLTENLDIDVLPLGCISALKPAPRPAPDARFQIVYFSHLYPYKGPKVLIDAFMKLKQRDQAELHLFGGEVLPDFAKQLKERAKGAAVHFHGPYTPSDLESFPMDVVVLPTLAPESYSLILDEAASLQVPLIASRIGAIPERANASMTLFEPGDAAGLADILDSLIADSSRLEAMRSAPPVTVMSMSEHVDRLEEIYRRSVDQGVGPPDKRRLHRHLMDLWMRREFGFKELVRSEKWELLVGFLKQRIQELEAELERRKS